MPDRSAHDVRMRGFLQRTTVARAIEWVDEQPSPVGSETIAVQDACGRILASDLTAPCDVPGFDRAAMDGYALHGDETTGASSYNPLEFAIAGESLPGRPYGAEVHSGQAVRIMTGAPLPQGADAVVPAEFAAETEGRVAVMAPVPPLKNVGRRGEDIRKGTVVLSRGRRLRPQDLGVIASLGVDRIPVIARPRVRIVVTGNELVPPGQPKDDFQIYDANSAMLRALAERDGGTVESICVRDDRDAIRGAMEAGGTDVILISGGSSVGAEDHAPALVAQLGELAIHGIAMRPSSPAGMGRIGAVCVFLLPGNPVSCLCAYDFFAGRLIRRWAGRNKDWPYPRLTAELSQKIASAIGRVDYCRVRLEDGRVRPLALSGASILTSTTRADGFVIVPAELEGYAAGTTVDVLLYDTAG